MVYVFEDGREAVRCTRADGIGLRKLERLGVEPYIISSEPNDVVAHRSRKLKIGFIHGCKDKRAALKELLQTRGLTPDQAAFVGNDINDLSALQFVGLPIVVQDAHSEVISVAKYRTNRPGGHGAVREICDLFEAVYGT
ncbi:MAG: HAD hydrolase family protein [Chloroflexi bacterium]|nr:HAD hydrolase family protein [Chloroflexota bacterium]